MIFFRGHYERVARAAAFVTAALFCLGASSSAAETAVFRFLRSAVSPRHIAMGEISSSFAPEPLGVAQNPSLAALTKSREFAFAGASRFDGAAVDFAAAGVLRDFRQGGSAVGFTMNLMTSSHERTLAPASPGSYLFTDAGGFTTYSSAVGGFYSARVQDTTYFGVSGKVIAEKLYSESNSGAAADVALMEMVNANSLFCLGARNVGASFAPAGYALPTSAYISILAKNPGAAVAVEAESDMQGFAEGKLGAEIPVGRTFDIRFGFRHPFKEYDTGDFVLSRVSAGFGLKLDGLYFDYAWQPRGDLGSSHIVSVRKKL
ncbi:MAG: hypothetical protein QME32_05660 [Endomicrobiia bacterium]|nr:hypothetical protein [Endomicrobiia bacterium]